MNFPWSAINQSNHSILNATDICAMFSPRHYEKMEVNMVRCLVLERQTLSNGESHTWNVLTEDSSPPSEIYAEWQHLFKEILVLVIHYLQVEEEK